MKRLLNIILLTVITWSAILAGMAYGPEFFERISSGRLFSRPCSKPVAYSIGNIDERFDITREELSSIIDKAAGNWEQAAGRDLFMEKESGGLVISLVYDSRQEATDEIRKLGLDIKGDRQSYENLKSLYDAKAGEYGRKKAGLDKSINDFEVRKAIYMREVEEWNRKGGAPKEQFERLERERMEISAWSESINKSVSDLNRRTKEVNALAHTLNALAKDLNLKVDDYNSIGEERSGTEFQEGVYVRDKNREYINIYEFSDQEMLLRVMTHELGHALDLEHSKNPEDVMYYLNEGGAVEVTQSDKKALRLKCKLDD